MLRSLSISSFFFFNDTATTEIYTLSLHDALPISAAVELHVQLEVFKFGIIDQFRTVSRADQVTVFNLPHRRTWSGHFPSCQIFAIEQRNRLAPFRCTASLQ